MYIFYFSVGQTRTICIGVVLIVPPEKANREKAMNLVPIYKLLDASAAPPHSKAVISGLLSCEGHLKVSREHFDADQDLQALNRLGLVTFEAGSLVVTKKAYRLAGLVPAV